MTKPSPFKYFKTSPEIIRLAVMMYVRFPLSLCNVEDLLHERGIDIGHEGAVLVEPVWPHVRRRDPSAAGGPDAESLTLAMASR
jgi:transposase-like protein